MVCYFLELQVINRVRGSPPGPTESPAHMNGRKVPVCPIVYIWGMFLAAPLQKKKNKKPHTSPSTSILQLVLCSMLGSPSPSSSAATHPQRRSSHSSLFREVFSGQDGSLSHTSEPQYFADNSIREFVSIPVTHQPSSQTVSIITAWWITTTFIFPVTNWGIVYMLQNLQRGYRSDISYFQSTL